MSAETHDPRRWGRWQIIALAVMFVGPAVFAWGMVLSGWRPAATTNNGTLVQPPVALDASGWAARGADALPEGLFRGRWSLMAAVAGDCGADCAALLDKLRRVRIALDKDMTRVQVVVVQPRQASGPADGAVFPGLSTLTAPRAAVASLVERAPTGGERMALHVLDYEGLRMMTHALPLDASALLDDLEKLLKNANEDAERIERLRSRGEGEA